MKIADCMNLAVKAGSSGIELVLSADGEINTGTGREKLDKIKKSSDAAKIEIEGIATGLLWKYCFCRQYIAHETVGAALCIVQRIGKRRNVSAL